LLIEELYLFNLLVHYVKVLIVDKEKPSREELGFSGSGTFYNLERTW